MTTYILYHGRCPDGFGAAYAAWKVFGDTAKYIPVSHGELPPQLPLGATVFIVDFAYHRDILLKMRQQHHVTVIDHHKTAQQDLAGLDDAIFDLNKSGAMLAWEYWHKSPAPKLIEYIQDRDLYRMKLPHCQQVVTALLSYPMEFEVWDKLDISTLIAQGEPICHYHDQMVELMATRMHWGKIDCYRVPIANATIAGSDVAHLLCKRFPEALFVAIYFDSGGKRFWTLTSEGKFDVSSIAQKYGGGGHANAAGFREILFPELNADSAMPSISLLPLF